MTTRIADIKARREAWDRTEDIPSLIQHAPADISFLLARLEQAEQLVRDVAVRGCVSQRCDCGTCVIFRAAALLAEGK